MTQDARLTVLGENRRGLLNLNQNLSNYSDILKDLFSRWTDVAPARMKQYQTWLQDFSNEAGFYHGIQIPPTEDTGIINIPTGCSILPVAYQRPDNQILPGIKRYVISKDLWDLMSETHKAGLVLHELIYRESIKAGHTTSFATRYFNGYLSSAAPNAEEYSYIVYKLPLEWVEIGKGSTLIIGKYDQNNMSGSWEFRYLSTISQEGNFEGTFNSDVKTTLIQTKTVIAEFNPLPGEFARFVNTPQELNLKMYGTLSRLKLIGNNYKLMLAKPIVFQKGNIIIKKNNNCHIPEFDDLRYPFNPAESWVLNDNGTKIQGVISTKALENSQITIKTLDGSNWISGINNCTFLKQ